MVQAGKTYILVNAKSGTVADLSGSDGKSIIGWGSQQSDNQKWRLERQDDGWTFRNVQTGLYLSVEGDVKNYGTVIASDNAYEWQIFDDDHNRDAKRIFVPNTRFNLDLSDHGNTTPGTAIHLWEKTPGTNQTWHFQEV